MRPDMAKVIVERPRYRRYADGKGYPYRHASLEDMPEKESMKKRWANRKTFNENLAPLRRWLEKQVGRKWDDVYSDAAKVIKPNSTVREHVKTHLFWMLALRVVEVEGVLYEAGSHGLSKLRDNELYVHPTTGILLRFKEKKRVAAKKPATFIEIQKMDVPPKGIPAPVGITPKNYYTAYEQINGIWYFIVGYVTDPAPYFWHAASRARWHQAEILTKRQLNHVELVANGLKNQTLI